MIIPDKQKKYSIPNNSDLFGNIHYTKGVNFDNEGYITQSPRAVNIIDSDDSTSFNIPTSFGRQQSGKFFTVTTDSPFILNLASTAITAVIDADNGGSAFPPALSTDSTGIWWQNEWHVTTHGTSNDHLFSKAPSTGNWTDHSISLTLGKVHPMEIFKTSPYQSLLIGNGNSVMQLATNYSTTASDSHALAQLTIPATLEVVDLAFNNGSVAVITRLSDTASGQGGEAYFFTWDGASNGASGAWGVGSNAIVSIAPYKSSWVIVTREGTVLYFNGGGFQKLTALPHYYFNRSWGDSVNRVGYGDLMTVIGDVIYFNFNNLMQQYGAKAEQYIPSEPGGILCYDPNVGLYQYASPSISKLTYHNVASSNVNTTTNIMTLTGSSLHDSSIPATGSPCKYIYDDTTQIGGLQVGTVYYIIRHTSTTFSLATTYQDAVDGNKIDLTSTGATGNHFIMLDVVDYGASFAYLTGGIAVAEQDTYVLNRFIFGSELYDSSTVKKYACVLITGFKNISYFVSAKETSSEIEDLYQKAYIKYQPLKTGEQIIIKEKTEDILGLPVTTPQHGTSCIWTSSSTFTTTADISEAYTYTGELECEIIGGTGAGQISKITSITELAGTYTVTLADTLEGITVSNYCNVLIENWRQIGTVSSTDPDGYKEFPIGKNSKLAKYKVILIGDGVTIEEFRTVTTAFKPAK